MERTTLDGATLRDLGWSADRAATFRAFTAAGWVPGRVISTGGATIASTNDGPVQVVIQRRAARDLADGPGLPAIGDWLALEPNPADPGSMALREVLPRTGVIGRGRSSDGGAQVLAANVELALLVSGLDRDLNPRRIERYLVLALDGGVTPIVVLNKVDVALDLSRAVAEVHAVAAGIRVIVTSALTGAGMDEVCALLEPGVTAVLLGSSGVGKSTMTNLLLDDAHQEVGAVREDDSKGRHTTTRRELFRLTDGGLLIDTPGLRTVGLLESQVGLAAAFGDIEALARDCRFADCRHETEPGCAVLAAIEAGSLSGERLASHRKLEAERHNAEIRADQRAHREADRHIGRLYRRSGRLASRYKRGET